MGAGRGKQRRTQSSVSEQLAQWLGELPDQLGVVLETIPDGPEKDSLHAMLDDVTATSVPKSQEALRSGAHDDEIEGNASLYRAQLAGLSGAWEEVQAALKLEEQLQKVEVLSAETGDKLLSAATPAKEENEVVLSEGERELMDEVLSESLDSGNPTPVEEQTLNSLLSKTRALGATSSYATMDEAEAGVFNQLFRVVRCPEGTRVLQESVKLYREGLQEEAEEDEEFAEQFPAVDKALAEVEKNVVLGGSPDQPCLIVVDIADAKAINDMRED